MSKIAVEAVRLWVKAYSDHLARLYKLLLFGHLLQNKEVLCRYDKPRYPE